MKANDTLFPSIVGYDDTVIPEISIAVLAGHDMLFLGEKGQAKSRLMRSLVRFLDKYVPYLDIPGSPVHEDPFKPITRAGKELVANAPEDKVPIAWWPRAERYAERLAPGMFWETDIDIPNITCTRCTLQVIQIMLNHPGVAEGGFTYHHCADLTITANPARPIDTRWPTPVPAQIPASRRGSG